MRTTRPVQHERTLVHVYFIYAKTGVLYIWSTLEYGKMLNN